MSVVLLFFIYSVAIKGVNLLKDDKTLKKHLPDDALCNSIPDNEFGRFLMEIIENYLNEHQNEFEKCLIFDEDSLSEIK